MSHNGIGLQTARGSGTSGHIQANLSNKKKNIDENLVSGNYKKRKLEEHERRVKKTIKPEAEKYTDERRVPREIEVKCMELREELEDQDKPESEIEDEVNTLRKRLTEEQKHGVDSGGIKPEKLTDSSAIKVNSKIAENSSDSVNKDTQSKTVKSKPSEKMIEKQGETYKYVPRYATRSKKR